MSHSSIARVLLEVAGHFRTTWRAWHKEVDRVDAFLVTLGLSFALVVSAPNVAAWLGLGGHRRDVGLASLAMIAIAVLPAVAFVRAHLWSSKRIEWLDAERAALIERLEAREIEVAALDVELRHQVGARSAEWAKALAGLGARLEGAVELLHDDVVGGRYRVVKRLGAGASGLVFEVRRVADDRPFALKIMSGPRDRITIARFAREAQVASRIRHPNVVSVVDVDVENRGVLFLVMDLVRGYPLRAASERFGDAPWAHAVLAQIAAGLAAIHAAAVVHRDLKPANVMLAEAGLDVAPLAKITDFGIAGLVVAEGAARSVGATTYVTPPSWTGSRLHGDGTLTEAGAVLGTPMYMAPETLHGANRVEVTADVFSFGVLAVELLTGARPFGNTPSSVALTSGRKLETSLGDPTRALAPAIVEIVERCLRVDPAERPTARALVDAFHQTVRSSGALRVAAAPSVDLRTVIAPLRPL